MTRKDVTIVFKAIIKDIQAEIHALKGMNDEDSKDYRYDCWQALQHVRGDFRAHLDGELAAADYADCDFGMYNPLTYWRPI